jgi:hypothetical protein
MAKYLLIITFFLTSCGQSWNSNSKDYLLSGNGIDPSNSNLVEAFSVINDKCINCHSGYHNSWSTLNTDQLWIASGNIVAKEPLSSPLITRLKNRGGDMPLLSSMLTETEYDTLVKWIENL